MTHEELQSFNAALEFGIWDNNRVQKLLDTLEDNPQALLPEAMGLVGWAAFLLTKVDRHDFGQRALLSCLAWSIETGTESEYGPTLIENIKHISKGCNQNLETEEIRRVAIGRQYGSAESWVVDWDASHRGLAPERAQLATGVRAGVTSKQPLTWFKGWVKRLDPTVLNAGGRALMREVFSRFGGDQMSPADYFAQTARLQSLGVQTPPRALEEISVMRQLMEAGVTVQLRRHRRFAGGDGRLPFSCYSTICSTLEGDDAGTLNREMMEYVNRFIPGTVVVGDSSDPRLNERLGHPVDVMPGFCALYVLLFAPGEANARKTFEAVYAETLQGRHAPVCMNILETRIDYVEIDGVFDLRLPQTQAWFCEHFRKGDGIHLRKVNGAPIGDFYSMLPTLMHPELGGCDTTHGIGSWMRTSRIKALIYPSARSDATVKIRDGELVWSRGWNMVDYRSSFAVASSELIETRNLGIPLMNFRHFTPDHPSN